MKITFVLPCVGRKPGETYPKSWRMEPLAFAQLKTLTPDGHECRFYDDRMETVPVDEATDLVAINAETYTARRAYQLAAQYRKRGVPVLLGGFHPTLMPDEAEEHADAVLVGQAEGVWPQILEDLEAARLQKRYVGDPCPNLASITPDRSIFAGKDYGVLTLIETARGCKFDCEFCSITNYFHQRHITRPIADVVAELKACNARNVFFIDDNICVDRARARELFEALIPLKIRWCGQVPVNVARDDEMLELMRRSGCIGALIGFESLNPKVLARMGKKVNGDAEYGDCLRRFRRHRISVYGTFVFGYDEDDEDAFEATLAFTMEHKLFFAAFNHLVPFPGTPLYSRLEQEGRLIHDRWWLADEYRFGQVAFQPKLMSPDKLARLCYEYRRKFYSWHSILRRSMDVQANCSSLFMAAVYYSQNVLSGREVTRRQGLPMGIPEEVAVC